MTNSWSYLLSISISLFITNKQKEVLSSFIFLSPVGVLGEDALWIHALNSCEWWPELCRGEVCWFFCLFVFFRPNWRLFHFVLNLIFQSWLYPCSTCMCTLASRRETGLCCFNVLTPEFPWESQGIGDTDLSSKRLRNAINL